MLSKKPVSAEDRELMTRSTIASQMPVQFGNGACWTSIDGQCKSCGQNIPPGRLTGTVLRQSKSVAVVEAIGVCVPCKLATRFHYRLHDDMRITGMADGRWVTWRPRRSFLDHVREGWRRLFA